MNKPPDNANTTLTPQSYRRTLWRRLWRRRRGRLGLFFVFLLIIIWLFAPLLATNQPIVCRYQGRWYFPAVVEVLQCRQVDEHWINKSPPFNKPQFDAKKELTPKAFAVWPIIPYHEREQNPEFLAPPSKQHWLGTDQLGRDVAARMIHGAAVSVQVGFVSMTIAALIGIIVGGLAGYCGGRVDIFISRIIEVIICFPVFFLILTIMAWLKPNILNVMIVIGLTRWTGVARYARGEFLRIKSLDYITTARALGASPLRIMLKHILPNALAPILVYITFGIAGAVLLEAGLSWLGFGVQPPHPSWGNILRSAYESLRSAPHLAYPPCVMIFLTVLSYNLIGDALRDAINPKTSPGS